MASKELPPSENIADVEKVVEAVVDIKEDGVNTEKDQYKGESDQKVTFRHYLRIFTYGTKLDIFFLVIAIVASVGAGVTMPLMNIIFGKLVGSFSSFFTPGSTLTSDEFSRSINHQTLFYVYLWIAKFSLVYIAMFSLRVIGIRISAAIRLAYLKALFAQPISVLDKMPPGSAAGIITGQANLLQIGISEKMVNFFESVALLIASFIIAFVYSWRLTLACTSLLLFILIVYGAIVPFMVKFQKSKDFADEKSSAIASEVFSSARMIAACGAEGKVAKRFGGWVEESRRRGLKLGPILGLQMAPFFFALFADFALTFWFGIRLYIQGHIQSVGTVLIVLMSVLLAVSSLSQIITPVIAATKAAGAATSFFALIDSPGVKSGGLKSPEVSAKADIVLEDIVFAYPSRPHVKVLNQLNVTFETGKLTAIVGSSGSGKSTIVGLLERWYELSTPLDIDSTSTLSSAKDSAIQSSVTEKAEPISLGGNISIGGHDISNLDLKWWRSQIGLVQQEPFIFNDTIRNNVAQGLIGTPYEHADNDTKFKLVKEACEEAFAAEYIDRLPLGYETIVGESGIKLSGGQRQRLAIARSIIKRPQILIFDEATSAIDVRGERKVQEALDRVAKNRTTITIAHRLSTIKKADKIVVVRKGRVIEQGTHDELLASKGAYHGLVFAQSLTMQDPTKAAEDDEEAEAEDNLTMARTTSKPQAFNTDDIDSGVQDTGYKQQGVIRSFGRLLIEQKHHLPWLYLTLLGALGASVSQPLQAYLMAQVVTVFESIDPEVLSSGASYWSLRFLYLAIGVGVAYYIIGLASNAFSQHISSTYRQEYFESIIKQPIGFYDMEDHSVGTLVSRVSGDPIQLQEMLGANMAFALIALFSTLGCVIIAFTFGWKLSLVAVFSAMPIILGAAFYRVRFEMQFEKMNAAVFAESSKFAAEAISAFRTVTSLTLEDMITDRYAKLLQGHVDAAAKKARLTTLVFALSNSVGLLCMALTFWYGGKLMANREYNPLIFLIIYIGIVSGSEQSGMFMSFGPNLAQATAAANRILSFRHKTGEKRITVSMPSPSGSSQGAALSFKDIHFTYPTRSVPIFRGLNLEIKAGQFVGLVGPSGCGKTSIISLLEQFYQIGKGSILFDGVDIMDLDLAEYRKAFSLVAQEATLFQGTIKENILLGTEEGTVSEERIFEACRQAEIHTFIQSLPEAYETDIGSRGVALSGGQKQRIAIARALIRNPRVLLLDEATSSLDSESERLVQAAFEKAGKGRTMVVVAHRLATVQNADVIFVLGDGGKVVESGSHDELVRRRGVYFQMCQHQALDR